MPTLIDRFGNLVGNAIANHPHRSLGLLKFGYFASEQQARFLPDRKLLSHQRYAVLASAQAIRKPLMRPESSAVVNLFFPCELLHAVNIMPQFTEGLSCYIQGAGCESHFLHYAQDCGVPQTYCSYHKVLLGTALSHVLPKPRFVVNTTLACDANTNTFRTLAEHWNVPHFVIDVPNTNSEAAITYIENQIHELVFFLEEVTGKPFSEKKLVAVIQRENQSLDMYREYFALLPHIYLPNELTCEMRKLFFTHILLGTPQAQRYFKLLLEDARRASPVQDQIRILWVHTIPYWQEAYKRVFNFSKKYEVITSDLNFDSLEHLDESRPYRALAKKLANNSQGGPSMRRIEAVRTMATALHADGVIYFCHWGCKQTLGNAFLVKDVLERSGFPTLILDGDGCDRNNNNDGQLNTRLQAYLELLEAKK